MKLGKLFGDGEPSELVLSEEGKIELEKIKKKVDEDFKYLWDTLDKYLKGTDYTHEDVRGFGNFMYVVDKKTSKRLYLK